MTETPQTVGEARAHEQAQQAAPQQPSSESKAVVPVGVGVALRDLDEVWRFSKAIAAADTVPTALKNKPSNVLAQVALGQELRIGPMQSVMAIYVVKGKPQVSGDLWTTLIRRAGHKVRWGQCDNKSATVTVIRRDDPDYPHTETFTIEDAEQAGLCKIVDGKVQARSRKDGKEEILPWEKYTKRMLMNRAISFAGKAQCPEAVLGLSVEGDYDYIDTDAEDVVEAAPGPQMHGQQQPMSQADLQQAVAAAAQSYRGDGPEDAPPGTVDAEIVDDQQAETPPAPADPEADLFAAADEQAAREMGQSDDDA